MPSPPATSPVEHWTFQVDSPFRGPSEIRELAGRPPSTSPGVDPETEDVFGELSGEDEFEAYDEVEPSSEADAYEEPESARADLLDEATPIDHPLAAVFSLPRLAFDAMAKGGWTVAIATAIGAGLRDVNQLTNMVFWFRHPQFIGQKLGPDQRDLVREWLQIRDQVVRPALAGGSTVTAPTPQPPAPAIGTGGGRSSIPGDGLRWYGPPGAETPELMAFMRTVYDKHVARSRKPGNTFVDTLPTTATDTVEGGHVMRKDAAAEARRMLADARAALAAQGLTGSVRIGVLSAYRSADHQFRIWQGQTTKGSGGFPHYYEETRAARRKPKYGGEHSDGAADYLAGFMASYVAAPGYSNHQDGLALDLGTRKGKGGLIKLYQGSWFHNWMRENAHRYHFEPLKSEAWHWTYRPPGGGSSSEMWESSGSESWESEVTPTAIRAGRLEVPRVPLLARHKGRSPDLVLRWNDMPTVPREIDVVVHLHGYSFATMTLPKHMEVWSGLDLSPVDGASGAGRSRPTLTVLPRGHFTGVKVGRIYRYTFPALTTRDGLSTLVKVALAQFSDRTGGVTPTVGRLILTAHSGGGAPLMQILRNQAEQGLPGPDEVHVFDGLYQDPTPLAEWATRRIAADRRAALSGSAPASAMRVFFGPSTRTFSLRLERALAAPIGDATAPVRDRYRVESSRLGHWQIARQYGWRVLADPGVDVPDATRPAPVKRPDRLFEDEAFEAPFPAELETNVGEGESFESEDLHEWETEGETPAEAQPEELDLEEVGAPLFEELDEDLDEDATEDLDEDLADDLAADLADDLLTDLEDELDEDLADLAPYEAEDGLEALDELDELDKLGELEEDWTFAFPVRRPPTVGFEFDVHYGFIPGLITAPGMREPIDGADVTKHDESVHGFKVKRDGPRLEIATKPFTVDAAGKKEMEKAISHASRFAKQLTAGHNGSSGSSVTLAGVTGHPRPFKLPNAKVAGMPIARLPVDNVFKRSLDSVWAAPQATVAVRLDRVGALVRAIQSSEGKRAGVALTGSSTKRAGVRSEAAYRALEEVDKLRTAMLATSPPLKLKDGTVLDDKVFTPALHGFLVLLASYLWTSELTYRYDIGAPKGHRDYEPHAKAYLPMNVKAPFSEVFTKLLTDRERQAFRELFADGSARQRLFALARPGATLADGRRNLFPTGPKDGAEDTVHFRQRAEFTTVPTWDDLVDHTLDPTHRGWGERLLLPLSRPGVAGTKPILISKTSPRVAIELRRIGFASVYSHQWPGLMRSIFKLVDELDR